jgi:exodeoxyribonuclease-3
MRILSWNVNGIRSTHQKGCLDWLANSQAEIVCFQEIKVQKEQLSPELRNLDGFKYSFFNFAQKKGYSGVAVYCHKKPKKVVRRLGNRRFDSEGRLLELYFPQFVLLNFYLPHGGRQKENLDYKLAAYEAIFKRVKELKKQRLILIGDFNIAHQEVDLARPKQNKNNIMFTPIERAQIDRLLELGFVDSFRRFRKAGGFYTWWPYAFQARERNLGWRIDYVFVGKTLGSKLKKAEILTKVKGSDHCPIGVEF